MKALKNLLVRRSLALVLTVALAGLIAGPAFAEGEGSEESLCSEVLKKCIGDAIIYGIITRGAGFFFFMAYCLVGYDFCMRYVDESF